MRTKAPQKLERGKGWKMLLFGVPGVGKTPLIGSDPSRRVLIIRPPTDNTDSIFPPHQVEEIVIDDWTSQLESFQYVHQEGWKEFDDVWIDSLSGWQDFGLRDVLDDAVQRNPGKRGIEKAGILIPELGPDKGEYKINFERISNWIQDMCGLADEGKINLGITTHAIDYFDPVREETMLAPWIRGKDMIPKISGYMHIVAYLQEVHREGKEPQLQLLTNAKGFSGKDQFHAFPALKSGKRGMVGPTMPRIIEAIEARRETPEEAEAEPSGGVKQVRPKKAVKKIKKARKV